MNNFSRKTNKKKTDNNPFIKILEIQFFEKSDLQKWLPFVLFCSSLAFLYIANRIKAEKSKQELIELQRELKDKEAEYLTIKSDLMYKSKQSEVAKRVAPLGLIESSKHPEIIIKKKNE